MKMIETQIKHIITEMQKYYDDVIAIYKTTTLDAEIDKEQNPAVKILLKNLRDICADNNLIIHINTHIDVLRIYDDKARIYHNEQ